MTKREELENPNSCFSRATDDEFIFVLLERDICTPGTIRDWCERRIESGKNRPNDEQIVSALRSADRIESRGPLRKPDQTSKPLYVIVATGEGARAEIVTGDIHDAVHNFFCCCGKSWGACSTSDAAKDIDNPEEWTADEGGEPFSIQWDGETGRISLYRLSP